MSDTLHTPDLDPDDMRGAVRDFPQHLETGWERGEAAESFGLDAGGLDGVVVCGMGGSAIGGDLVRGFVEPSTPVPFLVNRGYTLPGWVGEKTLVIVSTYSGGTEETLSSFEDARQRGARCLVVTSGGDALELAESHGLDHVVIPGGLQPRAALGYSLGVVLRIARTLGLAELTDEAMAHALEQARQRADDHDRDADGNPARDLSADWQGSLPVVYTGVGLLEAVGMRWRTQIHENAKHPAVGNVLPELDHNEIMGFESGPQEVLSRMQVVALRDADDHPQVAKRFQATSELVSDAVGGWTEIEVADSTRLDRMLSLIQLGDAASFWLAMRKGVDPTPVETIQQLKKTLA